MSASKMNVSKKCAQCLKPTTRHCSKCKVLSVCSRECFKLAWKDHKADCESLQRARATVAGLDIPAAASGGPGIPLELTVAEYGEVFAAAEAVRRRHQRTVERLFGDDPTLQSREKIRFVVELLEALDLTSEANKNWPLSQKLGFNQAYNMVSKDTVGYLTKSEQKQIELH